ncbi:MAG: hypothetical protein ACRD0P_00395 [Stackebrandtia sp.]
MNPGIPESIRELIGDHDHADVVTLTTGDAATWTPEQWARAAFGDAAGRSGQFIWRVVLGLRLKRRTRPGQVAGWPIDGTGENWIRLRARSWMLIGQLVIRIEGDRVSMATVVRFRRRIGERVWNLLSGIHAKAAPEVLREAHEVLKSR